MKNLYDSLKPLIITVIAITATYKFDSISVFLLKVFDLPSDLIALTLSVTIQVLILGVIFAIVEYFIDKNVGKLDVSILNEDKLEGSTELILSDETYKRFYIKLKVIKYNKKFDRDIAKLKFTFPKGVTVDLEDDYYVFGKRENEVNVCPKDFNLGSKGDYARIPIIVARGSLNVFTKTRIRCTHNIRFWHCLTYIKYHEKSIQVKDENS